MRFSSIFQGLLALFSFFLTSTVNATINPPSNDYKANAMLITLDANGEFCGSGEGFNNYKAS